MQHSLIKPLVTLTVTVQVWSFGVGGLFGPGPWMFLHLLSVDLRCSISLSHFHLLLFFFIFPVPEASQQVCQSSWCFSGSSAWCLSSPLSIWSRVFLFSHPWVIFLLMFELQCYLSRAECRSDLSWLQVRVRPRCRLMLALRDEQMWSIWFIKSFWRY